MDSGKVKKEEPNELLWSALGNRKLLKNATKIEKKGAQVIIHGIDGRILEERVYGEEDIKRNLTVEYKKGIFIPLPEQSGRLGDADRQVDGITEPRDEGGECDNNHVLSSSCGIIHRSEPLGRPSVVSGQVRGACASRRSSASRNDAMLEPPHRGEAFGPSPCRKAKTIKKRNFCHFDPPLSYDSVRQKVEDPAWVAQHAFLPFLHVTLKERRYRKNKETGKKEAKIKKREIYYASHLDSHIYSYYALMLQQLYEDQLKGDPVNDSILAYRSLAKTNIHFARDVFEAIKRLAPCTVIAMDLEQFFDSLDHNLLKERWECILRKDKLPPDHFALYKSITNFSYCNLKEVIEVTKKVRRKHYWHYTTPEEFRRLIAGKDNEKKIIYKHLDDPTHSPKKKGIPQGSPISAVLANIYLLDFDKAVFTEVQNLGGKYYRYSDDLLFIIPGPKEIGKFVEQLILEKIKNARVCIQDSKTDRFRFDRDEKNRIILHGSKPLQYLGFTFDGKRILIRDSSIQRYYLKLRKAVRVQKSLDIYLKNKKKAGHAKFLTRFTNRGKRNFVQYALNAARIMNDKAIKRQLRKHLQITKRVLIY